MQTEFEKWWDAHKELNICNKEAAEKIWHAAQHAIINIVVNPPYIPKVGEKIRLLSLSNSDIIKEVTRVGENILKIYEIDYRYEKDGAVWYSSGILGEVEKVE